AGSGYLDPVNSDVGTSATFNRSLPLNQVPLISFNGQAYLDFVLDIHQSTQFLSLDQIQVSLSTSKTLGAPASTFYTTNGTYRGNATLVYDQNFGWGYTNGASTTWVALTSTLAPGSGGADMSLDIPLSALPASAFQSGVQGQLPLASNQF